jgi:hypothetical protein
VRVRKYAGRIFKETIMSIKSRQRSVKRASPTGNRPRLRGAISKPAPFDFTTFQNTAHKANQAHRDLKTRGAFGGSAIGRAKKKAA